MRNHPRIVLAGLLWVAVAPLFAQVPPEERIPITDPDRLEALGFPRSAPNVFVWSKADLGRNLPKDTAATRTAETWGTQGGYTTVQGYELQGDGEHELRFYRPLTGTYCFDGFSNGNYALARIQVPEGARLSQFLFWAYDAEPNLDLEFDVYETCQEVGISPPVNTLLGHGFTILSIGEYFGFVSLNDHTVNNRDCGYTVRVKFAEDRCAGGELLTVRKLQVIWARQVSPPPATASFNDVPTSHPFFQFVEALAKSEITGGCSAAPPLYCPDAPLTRGQMAVFLAKALGLQWP